MGESLSMSGKVEAAPEGWRRQAWQAAMAAAALFGLSLPFWRSYVNPALPASGVWIASLIVALLSAGCLLALRGRQTWLGPIVVGLMFIGLFLGPAYDRGIGYVWQKTNADVFDSVMRIERVVDSAITPDRVVRFWYDVDESAEPNPAAGNAKLAYFLDSAYSLYLWGYVDYTKQLPSGPVGDIRRLVNKKTTFVNLTLDSGKMTVRNRLLANRGILTGNERRWVIPSGYGPLWIILEDVLDDSGMH